MSIRMVVSDLDGTLLVSGKSISERNRRAVRELLEGGVIFTIATGRMFQSTAKIAQALGVSAPLITYNGALVKALSGEVLRAVYMDPALVAEVLSFGISRGWHMQVYSDDRLFYIEHNAFAESYEMMSGVVGEALGMGICNVKEGVTKILSIAENADEAIERGGLLKTAFGGDLDICRSAATYIEVVSAEVSKAAAVSALLSAHNLSSAEVMTIGDGGNDVTMIEAAGCGVAMGNAPDEVKAAADYVTTNCAADGFAEAVNKYVFGK